MEKHFTRTVGLTMFSILVFSLKMTIHFTSFIAGRQCCAKVLRGIRKSSKLVKSNEIAKQCHVNYENHGSSK